MKNDFSKAKRVLDSYIYLKERAYSHVGLVATLADINAALNKLNARHRYILKMIHFQGYRQYEVGDKLGIKKNTIYSVYQTALKHFDNAFFGGSDEV